MALTDCEVGQWPGAEIRVLASGDPALALVALHVLAVYYF